uniref:Uncharacterized protein n=1 Tax=Anguilla anguilla TaxID=7936 RepID=A0A0E9XP30_ANGAN
MMKSLMFSSQRMAHTEFGKCSSLSHSQHHYLSCTSHPPLLKQMVAGAFSLAKTHQTGPSEAPSFYTRKLLSVACNLAFSHCAPVK